MVCHALVKNATVERVGVQVGLDFDAMHIARLQLAAVLADAQAHGVAGVGDLVEERGGAGSADSNADGLLAVEGDRCVRRWGESRGVSEVKRIIYYFLLVSYYSLAITG